MEWTERNTDIVWPIMIVHLFKDDSRWSRLSGTIIRFIELDLLKYNKTFERSVLSWICPLFIPHCLCPGFHLAAEGGEGEEEEEDQ